MKDTSIVLKCRNKDLCSLFHQLLPVVREEQVVVGDTVAHWVIGTHHVQQGGEQRQRMSGRQRRVSQFTCISLMTEHGCIHDTVVTCFLWNRRKSPRG